MRRNNGSIWGLWPPEDGRTTGLCFAIGGGAGLKSSRGGRGFTFSALSAAFSVFFSALSAFFSTFFSVFFTAALT